VDRESRGESRERAESRKSESLCLYNVDWSRFEVLVEW
jgi:hypothetical protein